MTIIDPTIDYSNEDQTDRVVPAGTYAVTVSYIALKPGRKAPYYNVGLKVSEGKYQGSMVWEILSTSAAGFCVRKLAGFARACNFMHRFDPIADEVKFRKGVKDSLIRVEVEAEVDENGNERARAVSFEPLDYPDQQEASVSPIDPGTRETDGGDFDGGDGFGDDDDDFEEVPF